MKTITLMLCCVFLAGCVSIVETVQPDPGRHVPRGHDPSPSDYAYARAYRHSIMLHNALNQDRTLDAYAARSRSVYMDYADAGLAAKYDPTLDYTYRFARERSNMGQAARARAEIDAYRHIKTNTGWAATLHDSKSRDDIKFGQQLDR